MSEPLLAGSLTRSQIFVAYSTIAVRLIVMCVGAIFLTGGADDSSNNGDGFVIRAGNPFGSARFRQSRDVDDPGLAMCTTLWQHRAHQWRARALRRTQFASLRWTQDPGIQSNRCSLKCVGTAFP